MSTKEVYVVARVCNANDIKSADPKVIARYIDDNSLYDTLLGVDTDEGLKTVIVGTDGKEENTHMCMMVGATVPVEFVLEYSEVIKHFDNVLSKINTNIFWSYHATYAIIDALHDNGKQAEWWTQVIKEMNYSYQIKIFRECK
jgi:hypothetical protein